MVAGHQPFAAIAILFLPLPAIESVPYILGGAAFHVGYQLFLALSYRTGDLSQVYPIARGSAPVIVTLVSVFVLGVSLSGMELAAVALIAVGIMSLAIVRDHDSERNYQAAAFALMTGFFIAGYSLLDGLGARLAGNALSFWGWLSVVNALVYFPIVETLRPGITRDVMANHRKTALIVGSASFIAFAMVIWAFTQAPIALVTALRETSIVFALMIGTTFFRERLGIQKATATVVALAGVVLLRVSSLAG